MGVLLLGGCGSLGPLAQVTPAVLVPDLLLSTCGKPWRECWTLGFFACLFWQSKSSDPKKRCPSCKSKLAEGWKRSLCQECINSLVKEESMSACSDLIASVKKELDATIQSSPRKVYDHKSFERRYQSSGYEDPSKGSDTPEECQQGHYSHVFLVKKPSGSFSLILKLKLLTKSLFYRKCSYGLNFYSWESIDPRRQYISDTYLYIPINTRSEISQASSEYGGTYSSFAIPSLSFWPFIGSADIHESDGGGSCSVAPSGDRGDPLFRQPPSVCILKEKAAGRSGRGSKPSGVPGLDLEPPEVKLGAGSRGAISGLQNLFSVTTDLLTRREEQQGQSSSYYQLVLIRNIMTPFQASSSFSLASLGSQSRVFGQGSENSNQSEENAVVVEKAVSLIQGPSMVLSS